MKTRLLLSALFAAQAWVTAAGAPPTPVEANGRLAVQGNYIVNERGEKVQLRGFATHGMQWFNSFYADGKVFEAAAEAWGADVLRLTIYLSEDGYLTSKTITRAQFDAWIDQYVQVCVRKGIYIILDWHVHKPGWPGYYLPQAKEFFEKMAKKYADLPNVLYEIANEPSSASLTKEQSGSAATDPGHYVEWAEIVAYANEIIPIIRRNSPNSVVLVGTPSWSTLGVSSRGANAWKQVADNPLTHQNVVYVIHYYAAAHTFQASFDSAAVRLPLFASEWAASGFADSTPLDTTKGKAFLAILNRRKIGWTYWNISNSAPSPFAMFDTTTKSAGPFAPNGSNVTPTGRAVYRWLNTPADDWHQAVAIGRPEGRTPPSSLPVLAFDRQAGRLVLEVRRGGVSAEPARFGLDGKRLTEAARIGSR